MSRPKRGQLQRQERKAFFEGFLKHPHQVGSIIPSSRFLERRVVEVAEIRAAKTVVELGPGIGGTTRAILRAMPGDAKLVSIEINPQFHDFLSRIQDARLTLHLGGAGELREVMLQHRLEAADAVISGIPFSTMSRTSACQILEAISSALVPGGRFVAYQVLRRVESLCRPYFGPLRVDVELLNIPPLRVYRWEKLGSGPG